MLAPELLAAMASGCWAIGALFSANAASQMGAFAFTRWRLFFAMCLLWIAAIYVGRWPELTFESIAWLSVSSWIGILVGDTALFVCMNRLGPRRSGVLFATHSLFSALLAWLFLGESLWGWTLMGSSVLVSGVMVATLWGRREEETHVWENTRGNGFVGGFGYGCCHPHDEAFDEYRHRCCVGISSARHSQLWCSPFAVVVWLGLV
jgi:drug/metabolite transporter (DMT)-like permease